MDRTYLRLWFGQWISNLGTQISFYAFGLWLLSRTGQFEALALVALVVQLGRLLALPVLARRLAHWSCRWVMGLAYATGAGLTAGLALLLLRFDLAPPLFWLLPLLAMGAVAEAVLVVSFSSLIPRLVPSAQLGRANGLFATADGLVYLVAPFLGALLVARLGLLGVVWLDGCSFLLAFACVSLGGWPAAARGPAVPPGKKAVVRGGVRAASRAMSQVASVRALLLLGTGLMLGFAAAELLFPAWVLAALGPDRLAAALGISAAAYGLGLLLWQGLAHGCALWPWVLVLGLAVQGCVLLGAALQWCQSTAWLWFAGVALFNLAVPPVLAAQQCLWHSWVAPEQQPAWFSARYAWDWLARLLAVGVSGVVVDRLLQPLLRGWGWLLPWLGSGPGRAMAVSLALVGGVQLCVVAWQGPVLLRRGGRLV